MNAQNKRKFYIVRERIKAMLLTLHKEEYEDIYHESLSLDYLHGYFDAMESLNQFFTSSTLPYHAFWLELERLHSDNEKNLDPKLIIDMLTPKKDAKLKV